MAGDCSREGVPGGGHSIEHDARGRGMARGEETGEEEGDRVGRLSRPC